LMPSQIKKTTSCRAPEHAKVRFPVILFHGHRKCIIKSRK